MLQILSEKDKLTERFVQNQYFSLNMLKNDLVYRTSFIKIKSTKKSISGSAIDSDLFHMTMISILIFNTICSNLEQGFSF